MTGRPWSRVHSTHLSADFAHSSICLRHGGRFRQTRIIGHHVRERFVGSRAARSSEIRWLNVKQPTPTQLRLEAGLDHDQDRTRPRSSSVQLSSRGEPNLISNDAGSTGPSRVWSRLGDLSIRFARLALSESSSPPLRPELREFPAKTLDARPSRPVVEC